MTGLRAAAEEYLAMRRALGFKLITQGRHLMSFIGYCEARHAGHITTELALSWATQTARQQRQRLLEPPADGGSSPGTCKPWTRLPRSRPKTCCRTTTGGSPRTCTRRARSPR
jgi:hypothetical protein